MKAAASALEDWASTSSCRTRSSCGGHFRVEYQTEEGEALRNDDEFCHVAAWQFNGENQRPTPNLEPLIFENVKLAQRSYK